MKILVAGDWHSQLHEEAVTQSLRGMGHEVFEFRWHTYFQTRIVRGVALKTPWLKFQNKYITGPVLIQINRDFIRKCRDTNPSLVFIYRGTHIFRKTLYQARLLCPKCIFVGYNNDDPFGPGQPAYLWRHFLSALSEYDIVLAYRHVNIKDYIKSGARRVELLRSWFVPDRNYPVELTEAQVGRFQTEVVFVGHYEADGRLECLERLAEAGISFKLFGPGYEWNPALAKSLKLRNHIPVELVWNSEYNQALAGAKIALCFLSKLNRDTYTRRCFEIPAAGAMLMSEYSEDLTTMFKEGIEAEFFRSPEEMVTKIRRYLRDDSLRSQVASAGRSRLFRDGHDLDSRMKQVLGWVNTIASEKY